MSMFHINIGFCSVANRPMKQHYWRWRYFHCGDFICSQLPWEFEIRVLDFGKVTGLRDRIGGAKSHTGRLWWSGRADGREVVVFEMVQKIQHSIYTLCYLYISLSICHRIPCDMQHVYLPGAYSSITLRGSVYVPKGTYSMS